MRFNSNAYDKLYPRQKEKKDTNYSTDDEMITEENDDVSTELAVDEVTPSVSDGNSDESVGGAEDGTPGIDNPSGE